MREENLLLQASGISKRYGSTTALSGVSLDLRAGEVHCLVGENGAGKSSLVKIFTGLVVPDGGEVHIGDTNLHATSVSERRRLGVAAVHQHPGVFPDLSVVENLFAGRQPRKTGLFGWGIDRSRMREEAARALTTVGSKVNIDTRMSALSVGDRQVIEIAKAMIGEAKILILDEPTASLSSVDSDALYGIVDTLTAQGVGVLLITHRLDEVFRVADRVSVLRDGQLIETRPVDGFDRDGLVEMMVGRHIEPSQRASSTSSGAPALQVTDWRVPGTETTLKLGIDAGEIVGLAGLIGAGRTEFAHSIVGLSRRGVGSLTIGGEQISRGAMNPLRMMRRGLVYVSEDRHSSGLTLDRSIQENISLPDIRSLRSLTGGVRRREERAIAEEWIRRFDIRPAQPEAIVSSLSGGNQQKVLLARWLATEPSVLILDEPTAGVDVGAQAEIHGIIRQLAGTGVAIVLISSDMTEILGVSDRVVVFADGRISGEFVTGDTNAEQIMHAATDFDRDRVAS